MRHLRRGRIHAIQDKRLGKGGLVVKMITDTMVLFGAKFRCVMPTHVLTSEYYPKDGEEEGDRKA